VSIFLKSNECDANTYIGRIDHVEAGDTSAFKTIGHKENGSQQRCIGRKGLPPRLASTVNYTDPVSVDVDILPAVETKSAISQTTTWCGMMRCLPKLEERGRVLKVVFPVVVHPIIDIIGKGDLSGNSNIHAVQEGEIQD
jgi:hypothetical protein